MKKIFIIVFCLLFCSCRQSSKFNYKIKTIIEENTNTVIAINYPVTNLANINKEIKKYVNTSYNSFLENYNKISSLDQIYELNIDYSCSNLNNEYLSIALFKHISSKNDESIKNEVYTYNYNLKSKKKIKFSDISDNNTNTLIYNLLFENYGSNIKMEKIQNFNYDDINFSFDKKNVTLYIEGEKLCDNYNDIMKILIPLSYFNLLKNFKETEDNKLPTINPTINYIDLNKPVVALTFDDGPSIYTEKILDTLKKYNSNATFFVLGNKIEDHSNTIIKMYKNGNEIGNHSYNHRWLTKLSAKEQIEQISKTQYIIKKYTGYTPIYLRPTYGSVNQKLRNNTDLEIILWNVDTRDWKYKNVNTIVNNALKDVKDGSIILMHDTYKRTSEAVEILVPKLIEKGYQIVTISELKEAKKIKNKLNEKQ